MFVYDEPHRHGITFAQLKVLYQQADAMDQDMRIGVGFSGEIWRAETGQYGSSSSLYAFTAGACDICLISGLEFRRNPSTGALEYQRQDALDNHHYSRLVIAREAPTVELWTTAQVFGGDAPSTYYMPTAPELQDLIDILFSPENQTLMQVDGIMFQNWASPEPGQQQYTLADPEFGELREVVRNTAVRLRVLDE